MAFDRAALVDHFIDYLKALRRDPFNVGSITEEYQRIVDIAVVDFAGDLEATLLWNLKMRFEEEGLDDYLSALNEGCAKNILYAKFCKAVHLYHGDTLFGQDVYQALVIFNEILNSENMKMIEVTKKFLNPNLENANTVFSKARLLYEGGFGECQNEVAALELFYIIRYSEDKKGNKLLDEYIEKHPEIDAYLKKIDFHLKKIEEHYRKSNSKSNPWPIETVADFVRFHNEEIEEKNSNEILEWLIGFQNKLADINHPVTIALANLNYTEKVKLITALITKDIDSIIKVFAKHKVLHDLTKDPLFSNLTRHIKKKFFDGTIWVGPLVESIIRICYPNPDIKVKMRMLNDIFRKIPDTWMSLKVKKRLALSIDSLIDFDFQHFNYSEEPDYHFSMLQPRPRPHNFSFKEYQLMATQPDLLISDFILLTINFLRSTLKDKFPVNNLIEIQKCYLNLNYSRCLAEILLIVKSFENELNDSAAFINKCFRNVSMFNDNNYSRRYFETRLGQIQLSHIIEEKSEVDIQPAMLNSLNRIFISYDICLNNMDDLSACLNCLAKLDDPKLFARMEELQERSISYKARYVYTRPGFFNKEIEMHSLLGEQSLSHNFGVLLANQPQFYDQKSKKPMRNKIVDFKVKGNLLEQSESKYAARVAAICGHAFFLVALLEKYMKDHPDSKTLNEDVNNIVKVYAAKYVCQGYHGYSEVMFVFQDQQIKDIFDKYNVKVDMDFEQSPDVLCQAFDDAEEYSRIMGLKNRVLHEFFEKRELHALSSNKNLSPKDIKKLNALLSKGESKVSPKR